MKELKDGTKVSSRSYYFLLDWNEQDEHKTIYNSCGKMSLSELNALEYSLLFQYATAKEIESLRVKTNEMAN